MLLAAGNDLALLERDRPPKIREQLRLPLGRELWKQLLDLPGSPVADMGEPVTGGLRGPGSTVTKSRHVRSPFAAKEVRSREHRFVMVVIVQNALRLLGLAQHSAQGLAKPRSSCLSPGVGLRREKEGEKAMGSRPLGANPGPRGETPSRSVRFIRLHVAGGPTHNALGRRSTRNGRAGLFAGKPVAFRPWRVSLAQALARSGVYEELSSDIPSLQHFADHRDLFQVEDEEIFEHYQKEYFNGVYQRFRAQLFNLSRDEEARLYAEFGRGMVSHWRNGRRPSAENRRLACEILDEPIVCKAAAYEACVSALKLVRQSRVPPFEPAIAVLDTWNFRVLTRFVKHIKQFGATPEHLRESFLEEFAEAMSRANSLVPGFARERT